jgi:hypothetical protein
MTESDKELLQLVAPYIEILHQYGEPYVWRLKMSKTAFDEIAKNLDASIKSHSKDTRYLLTGEFAPCVMVYIAEWYKRCYDNAQSESLLKDFDTQEWQAIWEHCGFPKEKYVYQQEGGTHRWKESLFVLGGLAQPFRLQQNGELLLKLCQLYHDEDIPIETLSGINGSIAFRQSISNEHSLYWFFNQILSGNPPYDEEELRDPNSGSSLLIKAIKDADKKAREEKFRFNWLIRNVPEREHMHRRLKIALKPEEAGGKYRQYISYGRVRQWGIQHPEDVSRILFSLQFRDEADIVKAYDFEHPLFVFSNRGVEADNFVCWSTADEVVANHIPVQQFTSVQLWAKADDAEPRPVPKAFEFKDPLQVFKRRQEQYEWEDRTNNQADTAVLFSDNWQEITANGHLHMSRKAFFDREEGESIPYNWCNIFESIKLRSGNRTLSFDSQKGKDIVFPTCYPNDIKYEESFTVEHHYMEKFDEEDEEGAEIVEHIPILFGLQNIVCRHFESKDDIVGRECKPISVMHKVGREYVMVENTEDLTIGVKKLRVQVTDVSSSDITVFYVPWSKHQGSPVVRDFEKNEVRVAGVTVQNDYQRDHKEYAPCIEVRLGSNEDYIVVNVYRPQNLIELYHNDKLIEYHDNRGDVIKIPLMLCREFRVRDYGREGVKEYDCRRLMELYPSIYSLTLNAYYGLKPDWHLQSINADAPFNYLRLCFFDRNGQEDGNWVALDSNGTQFIAPSAIAEWRGPGLIFDSLMSPLCLHYRERIERRRVGGIGNQINAFVSSLETYDIAAKHRAYFFMFDKIGKLNETVRNGRMIDDILLPIIERSEGRITDKEIRDLQRFAFEFQFNWSDKLAEWNRESEKRPQINNVMYRISTLK